MNITLWLADFKQYWTEHKVPKVLSLFEKDVIYFETPFHKLESREELKTAWENIYSQQDIKLDLELFNSEDNAFSVLWRLEYIQNNKLNHFAGTYLIKLNNANLCTYFFHCCESK